MKPQKLLLIVSAIFSATLSLGGCTMIKQGINEVTSKASASKGAEYYEDENEAKTVIISMLEKKYNTTFSSVGNESYKKTEAGMVFSVDIKGKQGLIAHATLPQDRNIDLAKEMGAGVAPGLKDSYGSVYFTKKAYDTISPLFQGEPFEKYYVSLEYVNKLDRFGEPDLDLEMSLNDYFKKFGDYYVISIVLPDGKSEKEYADILYPFYQKMITKQKEAFDLTVYANNIEILSEYYITSTHYDGQMSYEDIENDMKSDMMHNQPQPKEEYLKDPYYNGE